MAFVTAVTDVQDSAGTTLVETIDAQGKRTRLPIALKLDASLAGSAIKVGDVVVVTLSQAGGGVAPAAVVAAIDGQNVSLGEVNAQQVTVASNVTVNGALSVAGEIDQGPAITKSGTAITTGGGSATLILLPLANNGAMSARIMLIARCAALPATYSLDNVSRLEVESGSLTSAGGDIFSNQTFGLPLSIGSGGWSAGAVTITANGPFAIITALASDGGSGTQVTIGNGGLTPPLTGRSVTISGVVGAASGTNGTHVPTWTGDDTFTIPTPGYTGYTSGGLVVFTAPPVVAWSVTATMVVVPVP